MAKPALPTLIRLAEQQVEQVQQQLQENRAAQAAAEARKTEWHQAIEAAYDTAQLHHAAADWQSAGLFQQRAHAQIEQILADLQQLQHQQHTLREALQAAFTQQKRYEILAEQQTLRAKRVAQRKAQAHLDDLRRREE